MTPERRNLRVDRRFPEPVGRINISSGTRSVKAFRARDQLLADLWSEGQVDTLLALKAGKVSWGQLLQMKKSKRLDSSNLLADVKLRAALWDARRPWVTRGGAGAVSEAIKGMRCTESTRERYRVSWRGLHALTSTVLSAAATVADLKIVPWKRLLRDWETSAASKNRARAALSVFLSEFLDDKWHPIRREILKGWGPVAKETKVAREITVDEFWRLMACVPEEAVPCFVTLAASGMRVGEYLASDIALRPNTFEIETAGKTGSKRYSVSPAFWREVSAAVPCRIAKAPRKSRGVQRDARYKRLAKFLRAASDATGIEVTIHYLRHLYVQLGVDEMPQSQVQHAVGHLTPGITGDYARRRESAGVARAVGERLKRREGA